MCTSDFHVTRTERVVRMMQQSGSVHSFDAEVLGAPTPKKVLLASYLREFVALTIYRLFGRA